MSKEIVGEVVAIGDEITCGRLLDTNSQWLSESLSELGVVVRFHTTIGDREADYQRMLRTAVGRADIIVSSGGLGPTEDDLTAQAVAQFAAKPLIFDERSWSHIEELFARRNRPIVPSNRKQALRPEGSEVIFNPHGTAPGFAMTLSEIPGRTARYFALPGVPAELREMWPAVAAQIVNRVGPRAFYQHSLHCFGAGESDIESMIPAEIMRRGRDPLVGITASQATITLRVAAVRPTLEAARQAVQPTLDQIRTVLRDYIYGENGQTLEDVVAKRLVALNKTISVIDLGLNGDVCSRLRTALGPNECSRSIGIQADDESLCRLLPFPADPARAQKARLVAAATNLRQKTDADFVLAISSMPTPEVARQVFCVALVTIRDEKFAALPCAGHPALRSIRACKAVLNWLRLNL